MSYSNDDMMEDEEQFAENANDFYDDYAEEVSDQEIFDERAEEVTPR